MDQVLPREKSCRFEEKIRIYLDWLALKITDNTDSDWCEENFDNSLLIGIYGILRITKTFSWTWMFESGFVAINQANSSNHRQRRENRILLRRNLGRAGVKTILDCNFFNFLYWISSHLLECYPVLSLKSDSWGASSKCWSRQYFSWLSTERKPYNQGLQAFPLRCPPGFLDIPTSPADSDKTLIYWKDPLLRRCTLGKSEFNALQYMCRHGVEIHSSPVLVCIFVHAFCNESTQVILSIWYFVSLPTSCQMIKIKSYVVIAFC